MRLIEKEMLQAINRNLKYNGGHWSKDNTAVYRRGSMGVDVFLHGHHIAHVTPNWHVEVNFDTLRAWPTKVTKSRLRALDVDVYTKKGITYVNGREIA